MESMTIIEGTKQERYEALLPQVKAVMSGETDDIACSSASRSEIIVPIRRNGEIIAVLDIDSEHLSTFDNTDRHYLEELVKLF